MPEQAQVTQAGAYTEYEPGAGVAVTQAGVYVAVTIWPFVGVAASQVGVYVMLEIAATRGRSFGTIIG